MLWGADRRLVASNAIASQLLELPPGLLTPGRTEDELISTMLDRGHYGQGEEAEARAHALRTTNRSGAFKAAR